MSEERPGVTGDAEGPQVSLSDCVCWVPGDAWRDVRCDRSVLAAHPGPSWLKLGPGLLQKDLRAPDIVIGADTIVVSPLLPAGWPPCPWRPRSGLRKAGSSRSI